MKKGAVVKFVAATVVFVALIGGCGGGGGSSAGGGGAAPAPPILLSGRTFSIAWPQRSRAISGPTSALSASVTFKAAASDGSDITVKVDRNASSSAYTGTYPISSSIVNTLSQVSASFYGGAGETGAVVATATGTVSTSTNDLTVSNFTLDSTVASVTIMDPGAITAGSAPVQLQFQIKDSKGATIAVTPGSAKWQLSGSSSAILTTDGKFSSAAAGTDGLTVTVDQMASPLFRITVSASSGSGGSGGTGATLPTCGATYTTPNYVAETDPVTKKENQTITWSGFPVDVYVANSVSFTVAGSPYATDQTVSDALTAWSNILTNGPSYDFVGTPSTSGITVTFTKLTSAPKAGDKLGVTTLTYSPTTRAIAKADTVIYYWDGMTDAQITQGLTFTLTHEMGHATFLDGHSTVVGDVMYYQNGPSETKTLTVRDSNTLNNAYCGVFPAAPLIRHAITTGLKTVTIGCIEYQPDTYTIKDLLR